MILNYYTVSAFINFLTSIIIGIFVILKNRKDQKNISFSIFAFLVGFWNLFYFVWQSSSESAESALLWLKILMFFVIIAPAFYFHFCLAVIGEIKKRIVILIANYLTFTFIAITDILGYFVQRVEPIMSFKYWPMATPFVTFYVVSLFIFYFYATFLLAKAYFESTGIKKLQLKYVIIGFFITFASGAFNLVPWYRIPIPPITHPLVSVYVVTTAYAITRYRLMDIRIVLKNILFYFGIAFSVYAIFYLIAFLYNLFFGSVFSEGGYLAGLFLAPFFAVLIYNGSAKLSGVINKYMFTSLYKYQETIKQASQDLQYNINLNRIADIVVYHINETLQPRAATFLFASDPVSKNKFYALNNYNFDKDKVLSLDYKTFSEFFKKQRQIIAKDELDEILQAEKNDDIRKNASKIKSYMEKNNISLCIPLKESHELAGLILLGETINKDSYTREDFNFLETLSQQTNIALNNAMLYKELEQKNISLQELLLAKDEFIRIANHQMNTPLSIMKNALAMVKEKSITVEEGIGYWSSGVKKMSETMNDIWNVLQLEGNVKFNLKETNIKKIIQEAVKDKKILILTLKKNIKVINKKPDFQIPAVLSDEQKISYAVNNLLDNGVYYTSSGSVSVDYKLIKNGEFLKISFFDTGMGMTEEEKAKIGQKFYRSARALKIKPDGSGLGIYICKKILEISNGEFSFESEGEGKGSVFSITLPIYK